MADSGLNIPVTVTATRIDATLLPSIFSLPYQLYVIQNGMDFGNVASKANDAGQGAYDAQVVNDRQDVTLLDHEIRLDTAEAEIVSLDGRVTVAESDIDYLQGVVVEHEIEITDLQYRTTRKKSELVFTGLSLTIPTTPTNFITLIKSLTPASGTFAPFFNTSLDKMVVFNENKTSAFKLSIIGTWAGGTTNRSIQLTFSGSVPDTLVESRDSATTTDNALFVTFFSVDKDGFLATNGTTLTIQSNGSIFTATAIKLIAEQ
ncbi:tail needle knob protein [Yersinia aldovae]|uniref:Sf6-type phage tail needle knob domain-containing protein n=1 Tax=Yersinia aldovae TaxID=29483 RepID=A0ABM9STI9_YERAL|nr:tail needle knob protein [Yersinia aldovae]CNL09742.1 Uncharacterised protein [Yersinia aldovae]